MRLLCLFISLLLIFAAATAKPLQSAAPNDADIFPLIRQTKAVPLLLAEDLPAPITRAAHDLAADVERVTGQRPELLQDTASNAKTVVLIGQLDQQPIRRLVEAGKLDVQDIQGQWESFVIQSVQDPLPGVDTALVITGSNMRGTIYGIYEVSQAIGVSPWYWWADVAVEHNLQVALPAGPYVQGPPSVKYRGIFINDEDWALHPWAAQTFDPELGDIGPKTYDKVFELLLRLKANMIWPAMHEVTKAFNLYPENAELAAKYGIVMGSSHAEPMLRNNVTEWTLPKSHFNYATHPDEVADYWEERVRQNGDFENIYTLGMRGIHDSGMTGGASDDEKVALLERVIKDQRDMLREHVNEDVTEVPQVFTPYKEVLDLYRKGLRVPEDVTLMWPDDNHGYIRHFPTSEERAREGGSGVYYHISYLGSPLAYLWLNSTPPAQIWEEMAKAYELGVRDQWIVNVGDIKPGEIGMEFFLQMAWDIDRWNLDTLPDFLPTWAAREFGPEHADAIAKLMRGYYRLNFQRRPEHLQWWLPYTRERDSALTEQERLERTAAFAALVQQAEGLTDQLPEADQDAFYELVYYPVVATAMANDRIFYNELYRHYFNHDPALARQYGLKARQSDARLTELTNRYNHEIAGGKWNRMMAVEPADNMWRSFRTVPVVLPAEGLVAEELDAKLFPREDIGGLLADAQAPKRFVEHEGVVAIEAEHFTARSAPDEASWQVIPELGRTGDAVAIFPVTAASFDQTNRTSKAAALEYAIRTTSSGAATLTLDLLPTYPIDEGHGLRLAVGIDDQAPQQVNVTRHTGSKQWKQAVLDHRLQVEVSLGEISAGSHRLKLYQVDAGVVVDRMVLHFGELPRGYLGPKETAE
ncbi:MAG: hypothetical protein E1N59_175 [Puniceicoccaceae bacterium 5H]|nr:MAG: hypothetical protein E1N59_175 [Puniceicoccaceae bacterium 5H]